MDNDKITRNTIPLSAEYKFNLIPIKANISVILLKILLLVGILPLCMISNKGINNDIPILSTKPTMTISIRLMNEMGEVQK